MTSAKFKIESGIQLLTRLTRKPEINNFYPILFTSGPYHGEIIEIFSDSGNSTSFLLIDLICEALIPIRLGGVEAGVLVFSTDGNLNLECLLNCMQKKLKSCTDHFDSSKASNLNAEELNNLLHDTLKNLYLLEIYDAAQFYATIHNLENILIKNSNVSLLIFDTLTAFYWSEQGFKITKMDLYVKTLLKIIQKVTKEYKVTILYTRPEYFSSNKNLESLEACGQHPYLEQVNYRVQLFQNEGGSYFTIKTFDSLAKKMFEIANSQIMWQ